MSMLVYMGEGGSHQLVYLHSLWIDYQYVTYEIFFRPIQTSYSIYNPEEDQFNSTMSKSLNKFMSRHNPISLSFKGHVLKKVTTEAK